MVWESSRSKMNVEVSTSTTRPTYHPTSNRWALTKETSAIVQSDANIVTVSHKSSTVRGRRESASNAPSGRHSNARMVTLDAGSRRPLLKRVGHQSGFSVTKKIVKGAR